MTHPLQKPCKIVKWSYLYGFTVKIENEEYYNFRLKEIVSVKNFVKHIWNKLSPLTAKLTTNDKFVLLTFPKGKTKVLPLNDKDPFHKTHQMEIKHMESEKKHAEAKSQFHQLLKELDITFNINFHPHREDADYIEVFLHGKKVFSGTTEDLQNHTKEKKNAN